MRILERRREPESTEEYDLDTVLARSAIYHELHATDPGKADDYWQFVERYYVQELGWDGDELAEYAWKADENLGRLETQRKQLEVTSHV